MNKQLFVYMVGFMNGLAASIIYIMVEKGLEMANRTPPIPMAMGLMTGGVAAIICTMVMVMILEKEKRVECQNK